MHPKELMPVAGPAKSQCPYDNLKLSPADNGHKVTYFERSPSSGSGSFDHVEMTHKEFVFNAKELKKALAKYKEIADCIMKYS
jgi:hypothetical protein